MLHAHGLLIGDDCKKKDKGFNAILYEGVDYCKNAKHIHVRNNVEFIAVLIGRAEPDLLGRYASSSINNTDVSPYLVVRSGIINNNNTCSLPGD